MTLIMHRKFILLDSIERICRVLDCGGDDILEFFAEVLNLGNETDMTKGKISDE